MEDYPNTGQGPSDTKRRRAEVDGVNIEEGPRNSQQIFNIDRSVTLYGGLVGSVLTGDNNSGTTETTFCEKEPMDTRQKEIADELDAWTRGMVKTSAFKKVMEMLKNGTNWITIKGSPGEGKTTVAKMALRELQKSGRQVFQVRTLEEFTEVTKTCSQPVIMLDDILGDIEFDHNAWLRWKDVFHKVLDVKEHRSHERVMATSDKKEVTVLLVERDYVLNGAADHMERLYDYIVQDSHMVDMSHSVKRDFEEKQLIWNAIVGSSGINLSQGFIEHIFYIESGHGFPHVCRLFVTLHKEIPNLSPESFFQMPLAFLSRTIKLFLKNKYKLILFKEMIKRQGRVSERDLETVDIEVKQQAKELIGSYLRMNGGYFEFDHPSIYDSVAFNLCNLHTLFVIENCSLPFIHERLRLEPPNDAERRSVSKEPDLAVYISQPYAGDLAKRFAAEISSRNICRVLSHHACKQDMFIKQMMSEITIPLAELIRLTDSDDNFSDDISSSLNSTDFLFLLSSSRSSHLLKYIDNHPDIQLTQSDINTVLCGVCVHAASDVLTYLKQTCHTLDMTVRYGHKDESPLMLSARTRDSDFVSHIMSFQPDLSASDKFGSTVLHRMCEFGHVSVVNQLIDMGIDIDTGIDIKDSRFPGRQSMSPLTVACLCNQVEVVRLLLGKGAKFDHDTLLHTCNYGNTDIMKIMLKLNASPDRVPLDMEDFLYVTCAEGEIELNEDMICCLVEGGASVNKTNEDRSLLHMACDGNQSQIVQCLVELGAHIDSRDDDGNTPLHAAARIGSDECIDVLLKAGAKVNVQSKEGHTPLHIAAGLTSDKYINVLLKAGAEVNAQSEVGYTPLHIAAGWGTDKYIDVLLKAGAKVNEQSNVGYTPLHIAASRGSDTCIDVLLKAGAVVNAQSKDGENSLHLALSDSLFSDPPNLPDMLVLQTLIKQGVDINQQDREGNTPLHLLCRVDSDNKIYEDSGANDTDTDTDSETDTGVSANGSFQLASAHQEEFNQLVKLFMDSSADGEILNNRGEPALRGWCKHLFQVYGDQRT